VNQPVLDSGDGPGSRVGRCLFPHPENKVQSDVPVPIGHQAPCWAYASHMFVALAHRPHAREEVHTKMCIRQCCHGHHPLHSSFLLSFLICEKGSQQ
jgi:hypothetical protein